MHCQIIRDEAYDYVTSMTIVGIDLGYTAYTTRGIKVVCLFSV